MSQGYFLKKHFLKKWTPTQTIQVLIVFQVWLILFCVHFFSWTGCKIYTVFDLSLSYFVCDAWKMLWGGKPAQQPILPLHVACWDMQSGTFAAYFSSGEEFCGKNNQPDSPCMPPLTGVIGTVGRGIHNTILIVCLWKSEGERVKNSHFIFGQNIFHGCNSWVASFFGKSIVNTNMALPPFSSSQQPWGWKRVTGPRLPGDLTLDRLVPSLNTTNSIVNLYICPSYQPRRPFITNVPHLWKQ